MSKCTLQDESRKLEQTFNAVDTSFSIDYDITSSLDIKVGWFSCFHLGTFIEALPKSEDENLYVYTFLVSNHTKAINEVRGLIAKLKLRNLPIPSISVLHNNYHDNQKIPYIEYRIHVNKRGVQNYFLSLYGSKKGSVSTEDRANAKNEEEQYLSMLRPVIVNICEAIALTIYHHLQDAHGSTGT